MLGGIYYDRAMVAKDAGDKDKTNENLNEAIKVYRNTLKLSPNDPNILAGLNDSYVIAGRTQEAMDSYKAAIVADPNNKLVHYNYGVLLLRAKNFPEATAQFEETLKLDDKFTDALYNVGATYMQWGAKMKDEAEKAVKDDKNKQIDRSYEEKFKKAKANLEKLLDINKDDVAAWETLGMACTILNLPKEAKTAYEKADNLRKSK
jgi:tetratricopeptide (TPR) repeat protein